MIPDNSKEILVGNIEISPLETVIISLTDKTLYCKVGNDVTGH